MCFSAFYYGPARIYHRRVYNQSFGEFESNDFHTHPHEHARTHVHTHRSATCVGVMIGVHTSHPLTTLQKVTFGCGWVCVSVCVRRERGSVLRVCVYFPNQHIPHSQGGAPALYEAAGVGNNTIMRASRICTGAAPLNSG